MITKQELDKLVKQYETVDFIKDDPIQIPHKFETEEDITISAFVTSCFAYGNRKVFIQKLSELFNKIDNKPYEYVLNFDPILLENFSYRFSKDTDIICFFSKLHELYKNGSSIKKLFKQNFNGNIQQMMQNVCNYFYNDCSLTQGYCHLFPNPQKGCAMKRVSMFLRWMVRKPPVDFGIWDFISKSELVIPLDTHVARMSRKLDLLKRNSNDFKAVIELTQCLKQFDYDDPVKYDFALFGYGVTHK